MLSCFCAFFVRFVVECSSTSQARQEGRETKPEASEEEEAPKVTLDVKVQNGGRHLYGAPCNCVTITAGHAFHQQIISLI